MGAKATTFAVPPTESETKVHKSDYSDGGPYCSTDRTFEMKIRMGKQGAAALAPSTVGEKFKDQEMAGHIQLQRGERSSLSYLASLIL